MDPLLIVAVVLGTVGVLGAGLAIVMARQSDPALDQLAARLARLEQPKGQDPVIAENSRALAHLDQKLSQLSQRVNALMPPRPEPVQPRPRAEPPGPASPAPAGVALIKTDPPPAALQDVPRPEAAGADAQWVDRLLADYARMAEEGGSAVDAFMTRYDPVGAAAAGGSDLMIGEDPETAMLWAVSADARLYAILPGLRAVNNWGAHFAPSRKSTAQEQLGGAFELTPDTPGFAVRRAALAIAEEGQRRLALKHKGRLDGFTS